MNFELLCHYQNSDIYILVFHYILSEGTILLLFSLFQGNGWGNNENSERLYFWGAPKLLQMVTTVMKLKDACSLEEKL